MQYLPEFTDNNCYDEYDKDRDDGDGDYLVGSHPVDVSTEPLSSRFENVLPTRHPSQRLVTPIRISLALQQRTARVLNRLSLPAQIGKCVATNVLRVESHALTVPQSLTRPIQAFCTGK